MTGRGKGTQLPAQATAVAPGGPDLLLEAVVSFATVEGDLASLAARFTELARSVAGVDGVSVSRVVGEEIRAIAGSGILAAATGVRSSPEASLHGIVLATGTTQLSADTRADTRVDQAACEQLGVRSLGIVPLRTRGHTVALVMVASRSPGLVTAEVITMVAPLIRVATSRFAEAIAARTAAEQIGMLQHAADAGRRVLVADDPAQTLVDTIAELTGAPHVYLSEPTGDGRLKVTHDHGHSLLGRVTPADVTTPAGAAFSTGTTKIVADWTTSPTANRELIDALLRGEWRDARAAVAVPLMTSDGPVGVVTALLPEVLSAANAELLGRLALLASEAALAISRDRLQRSLAAAARTDPLTGLANRRVWGERLEQEVARAVRSDVAFAVAIADLDLFKRYNDTFGHPAGDALLAAAARAWQTVLRPSDLLARIGGEEFAVLLPDTSLVAAEGIVGRLGAVVPEQQTASIGLTMWRPEDGAEDLMQRADEALYAAKTGGRNRHVTH